MNIEFSFIVSDGMEPQRLDRFLGSQEGFVSRSQLKHRIAAILVNGAPAKLSTSVNSGDAVEGCLTQVDSEPMQPEPLTAPILYEDSDVIVVNKPAGMVVHPARGNYSGTLLHGLLGHVENMSKQFPDDDERPGIVHRLDKDTSGVLIAAKHTRAHEYLSQQFARRLVGKGYLAVVKNSPDQLSGGIETRIVRDPVYRQRFTACKTGSAGKIAATLYRVISCFEIEGRTYSLVVLYPRTGRTHQLRVHMKYMGCPILGDPMYSRPDRYLPDTGLMLHAALLQISIPWQDQYRSFFAPVPLRWEAILQLFIERDRLQQGYGAPEDRGWFESQLQSLRADHEPEKP